MSFFFKGINSDDMGVILEDEVFSSIPGQNYEEITVDGRDGSIYEPLGYKDTAFQKNATIVDLSQEDAVRAWLTGSGVFAINDRWKTGYIYDEIVFSRFGSFKKSFTLPIILSPYWKKIEDDFIDFGDVSTSDTLTVENTGNINSQPIVRITQETDDEIDIAINGTRFSLPDLGKGNSITIDCEDKSEDLPKNISIGYEYPQLSPGYNTVKVYAGAAKVEMRYKDRWI